MLGLAVRKTAKPPFFQIGTQNAHLECDFPPFWCGPPRKQLRPSHWSSPTALPGLSTLTGRWEEPVIPLHSFHTAMYAIRAYLLPCNHHKACREIKWMIRDRAPLASSKQICISVEAPLNSGTSCMVRDGKWATTHDSTLLGPEVRLYFPPGSILVFDTDCFLQVLKSTFGAKTTRITSQFFGKY